MNHKSQNGGGERYNGEGYLDLTAYYAIYGGYEMQIKWKEGDVLGVILPDGREVFKVIIKKHKGYATVLNLYDTEQKQNEFAISVGGMHADLGKPGYSSASVLEYAELQGTLAAEELDALRCMIAKTIGVKKTELDEPEIDYQSECEELRKQVSCLAAQVERLKKELEEAKLEEKAIPDQNANSQHDIENETGFDIQNQAFITVVAERNVYERLYRDLIRRVVPEKTMCQQQIDANFEAGDVSDEADGKREGNL